MEGTIRELTDVKDVEEHITKEAMRAEFSVPMPAPEEVSEANKALAAALASGDPAEVAKARLSLKGAEIARGEVTGRLALNNDLIVLCNESFPIVPDGVAPTHPPGLSAEERIGALRAVIEQRLSKGITADMATMSSSHSVMAQHLRDVVGAQQDNLKVLLAIKEGLEDSGNRLKAAKIYLNVMLQSRDDLRGAQTLALLLGQMLPDAPMYILGSLFKPMQMILNSGGEFVKDDFFYHPPGQELTMENLCPELSDSPFFKIYPTLLGVGPVLLEPRYWKQLYEKILGTICIEQLLVGAALCCIPTIGKLNINAPDEEGELWTEYRTERFSDTSQLNQSFILAEYSFTISEALFSESIRILNTNAIDAMTTALILEPNMLVLLFNYLIVQKNKMPEASLSCDQFLNALSLLNLIFNVDLNRREKSDMKTEHLNAYAFVLCGNPVVPKHTPELGWDIYNRLQNYLFDYNPVVTVGSVLPLPPLNPSGQHQPFSVGGDTKYPKRESLGHYNPWPKDTVGSSPRRRRKNMSKSRRRKSKSKSRRRKSGGRKSKSRRRKSKSKSRRRKSKSKSRRRKSGGRKSKSRHRKSKSKSRHRKSKSKSRRRKSKSKSRRRKSKSKSRRRKSKSKSRRRKSKSKSRRRKSKSKSRRRKSKSKSRKR